MAPDDGPAESTPADTDLAAEASDRSAAAEKVKAFPQTPGVYLMKDAAGRVIYIGKAKNLRARASSYFLKAAEQDRRTAELVREIRDIDFLEAESEVDALLLESRLIKDVQPRFNSDLKDDKTFPYLQITTHEDYPRVEFTREPRRKGVKLYGPFPSAGSLRGAMVVLQRIFKFRTCTLDIEADDRKWQWFRPCLLASIGRTALLRIRPRCLHDVPHGLRRGLLLQGPRCVSVLQRPPHGTDRRTPRRSRHPAGARATVGDLRAEAIAGHAGRPTPSRRCPHEDLS